MLSQFNFVFESGFASLSTGSAGLASGFSHEHRQYTSRKRRTPTPGGGIEQGGTEGADSFSPIRSCPFAVEWGDANLSTKNYHSPPRNVYPSRVTPRPTADVQNAFSYAQGRTNRHPETQNDTVAFGTLSPSPSAAPPALKTSGPSDQVSKTAQRACWGGSPFDDAPIVLEQGAREGPRQQGDLYASTYGGSPPQQFSPNKTEASLPHSHPSVPPNGPLPPPLHSSICPPPVSRPLPPSSPQSVEAVPKQGEGGKRYVVDHHGKVHDRFDHSTHARVMGGGDLREPDGVQMCAHPQTTDDHILYHPTRGQTQGQGRAEQSVKRFSDNPFTYEEPRPPPGSAEPQSAQKQLPATPVPSFRTNEIVEGNQIRRIPKGSSPERNKSKFNFKDFSTLPASPPRSRSVTPFRRGRTSSPPLPPNKVTPSSEASRLIAEGRRDLLFVSFGAPPSRPPSPNGHSLRGTVPLASPSYFTHTATEDLREHHPSPLPAFQSPGQPGSGDMNSNTLRASVPPPQPFVAPVTVSLQDENYPRSALANPSAHASQISQQPEAPVNAPHFTPRGWSDVHSQKEGYVDQGGLWTARGGPQDQEVQAKKNAPSALSLSSRQQQLQRQAVGRWHREGSQVAAALQCPDSPVQMHAPGGQKFRRNSPFAAPFASPLCTRMLDPDSPPRSFSGLRKSLRVIFLIGAPGSGRRDLAAAVASGSTGAAHSVCVLSMGDAIRRAVEKKSPYHQRFAESLYRRRQAETNAVRHLLETELRKMGQLEGVACPTGLILLEGFPRDLEQLMMFEQRFGLPHCALFLRVPRGLLLSRLLVKAAESGRDPDVARRHAEEALRDFEEHTPALLENLRARNLLKVLSGTVPFQHALEDLHLHLRRTACPAGLPLKEY
uniref:Adenylate kinase active site lid domain-containing protein n=1 Tax=Chromera velia CCMP2878 TaxID=1169474 RepID=A0A0G4GW95_9ALVE|eukprot:Cvel_5282.t1-p1 / transcript=Cvel_5282.t1 / gene=Cvel_5282 / organism=Chromera_velia_CCMP2878 / gene_product=hypothetical protein / transcript_product=hypothetical protein / location=Cvel_scaffold244:30793-35529(-) / protein_length=886 / sequence_SO=supercontig / SO=protein_coding / is_pseudo=false